MWSTNNLILILIVLTSVINFGNSGRSKYLIFTTNYQLLKQ